MGLRGPLQKDPSERQRRNKEDESGLTKKVVTITPEDRYEPPKNLDRAIGYTPHPLVADLWQSLLESPVQRDLWQPSDWRYAQFAMYAVNEMLTSPKGITAMMLQAVDTMMAKLLMTEADRRRLKIEVERGEAEQKLIDAAAAFQARFDAQRQDSGS